MSHPFVSESSSHQNLSILPVLHHVLSNANATSCHVLQPASRFLQWSSESRALQEPSTAWRRQWHGGWLVCWESRFGVCREGSGTVFGAGVWKVWVMVGGWLSVFWVSRLFCILGTKYGLS